MDLGEHAARFRFLIRDRAGQFTEASGAVLSTAGDRGSEDPATQPSGECPCRALGTHARSEVTGRMRITGPRHLRTVLDECAAHYNRHRPHRARNLRPPDDITMAAATGTAVPGIRGRRLLGGLINEYESTA